MAAAVATPLEKQFSTIAGLEDDHVDAASRATPRSRCSSRSTATSTPPRSDVQAAIAQTLRQLPQDIVPPTYQKVNPADSPIMFLRSPRLRSSCRSSTSTRRSTIGAAHLDGRGRGRRCRCSARRSTRCGSSSTPARWRARQIGIDEVSDAIAQGNVNLPTGILWGTDRAYRGRRPTASCRTRRSSARSSSRGATVARCGSRTSAASSTACRTPRRPRGTTADARHRRSRSSASRAPTPSRWRARVRNAMLRDRARSCRPRWRSTHASTTGRRRSGSRSRT